MAKLENVKTIDMVNGEITKVEYNGEIYAKVVGTPAEKGDLIQSKKEYRDITLGAFYKSISTGEDSPEFYDDVNDDAYLAEEYATVFRKQPDSQNASLDERVSVLESKVATLEGETGEEFITHKGAEYKLVDRKAQPGDVVVFTGSHASYIKNYKSYGPVSSAVWFIDEEGDGIPVYTEESDRTLSNVKVYEPVAQAEEPLKVGDYAKIVSDNYEYDEGNVVKIVGDNTTGYVGSFDFKVELVNVTGRTKYKGQTGGYIDAKNIVKATDEEVAEAKAQAKWAKIGRKPNEFKKGDIVRYVGKASDNGSIVEVPEDSVQGWTKIVWGNRGRSTEKNSDLELITPVESRFDRA